MQENRKRKKKAYYCQNKRLTYQYEIGVGMKGFLITCNNNEAKTVVEAYKVFNEYADKHYGTSNSLVILSLIFKYICISILLF